MLTHYVTDFTKDPLHLNSYAVQTLSSQGLSSTKGRFSNTTFSSSNLLQLTPISASNTTFETKQPLYNHFTTLSAKPTNKSTRDNVPPEHNSLRLSSTMRLYPTRLVNALPHYWPRQCQWRMRLPRHWHHTPDALPMPATPRSKRSHHR